MPDFTRLKEIPFDEVLNLYGVQFSRSTGGLSAVCPLPGHPEGDRKKTFSVRLPDNFFRCFSTKCNDASGGKRGGDIIAFVALMDGTNQGEAAKKLEAHFFGEVKGPEQIAGAGASHGGENRTGADKKSDTCTGNGNRGYMEQIAAWLKELLPRKAGESDDAYFKRVSKEVKTRLYASYKSGQASVNSAAPPK